MFELPNERLELLFEEELLCFESFVLLAKLLGLESDSLRTKWLNDSSLDKY